MKWTQEEITILKTYYPTEGTNIINRLPERALTAIQRKASSLKILRIKETSWSALEDDLLRQLYPLSGSNIIINKRSKSAIETRASRLNIKFLNAENIKYTNESFDTELLKLGINLKRIDSYINCKSPIQFMCIKCNYKWKTQPKHIINQESGCPICSGWLNYINSAGLTEVLQLYLVILNNEFIKVGITRFNYKKRLSEFFNKELLIEISGRAESIYNLEQSILKDNTLLKYTPTYKFSGHTECYNLSEKEQLINRIKEWKETQIIE